MVWDTQGKLCQPELDWMQCNTSGSNGRCVCVGGSQGSGAWKAERMRQDRCFLLICFGV